MTTRTLANGTTVQARSNSGLRKRCDCGRRAWTKACRHGWHANFSYDGKEHRISLNVWAKKPRGYVMLKAEAGKLFNAWKLEVQSGKTPARRSDRSTFAELAAEYSRLHIHVPSRRARAAYEMDLQIATLTAHFGAMAATEIGKGTIEDWRAARQRRTLVHASKGGEVGTNRLLTRLRHVFSWAIQTERLDASPFVRAGVTVIRCDSSVEKPRRRRLEGDEEDRLLRAASDHLRACIIAALESGMRRGEILGLTWADVRLETNLIVLPPETTKTNVMRVVPVTSRLRAVLDARRMAPDGQPHPPSAHVFGTAVGERILTIKTAWAAACRRAGVAGLHFHDLRREAGSRLLEVPGIELHDVREILGHTNVSTTSKYLAVSGQRQLDVREKIEQHRISRAKLAQSTETASAPPSEPEVQEAANTVH